MSSIYQTIENRLASLPIIYGKIHETAKRRHGENRYCKASVGPIEAEGYRASPTRRPAWLAGGEWVPEVGKMTTFYLRPIPLPSTQQVDDLAYLLKKCRGERSMLTTFDLWKGRGRRHDLSLTESVKFHPLKSRHLQVSMPKVLRCCSPSFQY